MPLTLERPAFELEPLSPILGASIVGLDLREPLPESTKRAVYDAFVRYHVLCFRDQHLTEQHLGHVVTARGELIQDFALRQQPRFLRGESTNGLGAGSRPSHASSSCSQGGLTLHHPGAFL